ncbi:MAG TPA: response regulator [Nitrolancea sp.]|jgi:DNA-binding response OmpR family regulator|nr:response regulator [Nitrolancea sp.]
MMIMGVVNPTILVVEDDEGIAELISFVLEEAGFEVYTESAIEPALRTFDDLHPRLVITDLMLPDGLGSDLIKRMHGRGDGDGAVGSILISAHPQAREHAVASHADAYLSKPFNLDDLYHVVEELLQ